MPDLDNIISNVPEGGLGEDRKAPQTDLPEGGSGGDRKAPQTDKICLGDVIKSRKPHPCGSDTWTVIRTGADIKMRCNGCGRIVMLDRDSFLRRRKAVLSRPAQPSETP